MSRLLIVIPYWRGDRDAALSLAGLLADLEPQKSDLADLALIHRADMSPPDSGTLGRLNKKFNTVAQPSGERGAGWPHGCNKIALGIFRWVISMSESGRWPTPYKAVAIIEPDAVPLRRNWITLLTEQWDEAQIRQPTVVAGDIVKIFKLAEHINATALYSADVEFLRALAKVIAGCPQNQGWDYYTRTFTRSRGWAQIGIHSLWRTPTFTEQQWENEQKRGTVLLHGVKDGSLLALARHKLVSQT